MDNSEKKLPDIPKDYLKTDEIKENGKIKKCKCPIIIVNKFTGNAAS